MFVFENESEVQRTVGLRIRELRLSLGLTTTELAARVEVSQGQISKIETGKATLSVAVLNRLCQVLDRPLSYLFQSDSEIPRVLGTMTTVVGPESRAQSWFARKVKELSQGRMSLVPLRAGSLDPTMDPIEQLRQGLIDLFIEELAVFHEFAPAVTVVSFPFSFRSESHQRAFLEGDFFRTSVRRPLLESNIRLLNRRWNWLRGIQRVLVSREPILTPDQVKGKRVRIIGSDLWRRFWEEMGAEPVEIPWTEVKTAWREGRFDVLPTHKTHLYPVGLCEFGRYVTLLDSIRPNLAVAMNELKHATLPPDIQKALVDACTEAGDHFTAEVERSEEENEARNLAEYGAVYLKVDLTPWQKAAAGIRKSLTAAGRFPPEWWAAVDRSAGG